MVSVQHDATDAIQAALIGSAAYFLLLFVTHLAYPAGMGFGDVKLALVMGLYLGWVGLDAPRSRWPARCGWSCTP